MKTVLLPEKPQEYLISLFHHLNEHRSHFLFSEPNPSHELFWANQEYHEDLQYLLVGFLICADWIIYVVNRIVTWLEEEGGIE